MVNHYYIYARDRDFGPFFLKFCSYFPYNAKLCLNGHEYAKQQLKQKQIEFQPLDDSGEDDLPATPSAFARLHRTLAAHTSLSRNHLWFARALFYTRTYVSVLRRGLSQIVSAQPPGDTRLRSHFDKTTEAVEQWCRDAKLAA